MSSSRKLMPLRMFSCLASMYPRLFFPTMVLSHSLVASSVIPRNTVFSPGWSLQSFCLEKSHISVHFSSGLLFSPSPWNLCCLPISLLPMFLSEVLEVLPAPVFLAKQCSTVERVLFLLRVPALSPITFMDLGSHFARPGK